MPDAYPASPLLTPLCLPVRAIANGLTDPLAFGLIFSSRNQSKASCSCVTLPTLVPTDPGLRPRRQPQLWRNMTVPQALTEALYPLHCTDTSGLRPSHRAICRPLWPNHQRCGLVGSGRQRIPHFTRILHRRIPRESQHCRPQKTSRRRRRTDGRSMSPSPRLRSGMNASLPPSASGMQKATREQTTPAGVGASSHRVERSLQIGGQFRSDNLRAILVRFPRQLLLSDS